MLFAQGVDVDVQALSVRRLRAVSKSMGVEGGGARRATEMSLTMGFSPMTLDPSGLTLGRPQQTDSWGAPAGASSESDVVSFQVENQITNSFESKSDEEERALPPQTSPPSPTPDDVQWSIAQDDLAGVAHRFLETMNHFLAVQERVMNAYLHSGSNGNGSYVNGAASNGAYVPERHSGYNANGNGARLNPVSLPAPSSAPEPGPVPPLSQTAPAYSNGGTAPVTPIPSNGTVASTPMTAAAPTTPSNGVAATATRVEPVPTEPVSEEAIPLIVALPELLRQLVSDRTGYPVDVIDVNADLEADLGIDSIKRVEILGTLRNQHPELQDINLELLTASRTIAQIVGVVAEEAGGNPFDLPSAGAIVQPAEGSQRSHDLLGELVGFQAGQMVVARLRIDPAETQWLKEHTIGRNVSVWDEHLTALPVMPLTLSLELLAQAAVLVSPGYVVTKMEAIRARKCLEFGDGPLLVEVRVERTPGDEAKYHGEIVIISEDKSAPAIQAELFLGDHYPSSPMTRLAVPDGRPSSLTPGDLYEQVMYHGPAWRGVAGIERTGPSGMSATLSVPSSLAFRDGGSAILSHIDPVALDAAGQLLGFWTAEHMDEGKLVFPIAVDSVEFFGPPSSPGESLSCVVSITESDDLRLKADFELVRSDAIQFRVRGWLDRRFHVPLAIEGIARPGAVPDLAVELIPDDVSIKEDNRTIYLQFETDMEDETGLLRRVWASRIRTRSERESGGLAVSSMLDLVAEHVAKEAVCRLVRTALGVSLYPADIGLEQGVEGELYGVGPWLASLSGQPVVWLVKNRTNVVAAASLHGIDAEVKRVVGRLVEEGSLGARFEKSGPR